MLRIRGRLLAAAGFAFALALALAIAWGAVAHAEPVPAIALDAGALEPELRALIAAELPDHRLAGAGAAEGPAIAVVVRRAGAWLQVAVSRGGTRVLVRAVPIDRGLTPALRVVALLVGEVALDGVPADAAAAGAERETTLASRVRAAIARDTVPRAKLSRTATAAKPKSPVSQGKSGSASGATSASTKLPDEARAAPSRKDAGAASDSSQSAKGAGTASDSAPSGKGAGSDSSQSASRAGAVRDSAQSANGAGAVRDSAQSGDGHEGAGAVRDSSQSANEAGAARDSAQSGDGHEGAGALAGDATQGPSTSDSSRDASKLDRRSPSDPLDLELSITTLLWQRPTAPQLGASLAAHYRTGDLALGARALLIGLGCCALDTPSLHADTPTELALFAEALYRLAALGPFTAHALAAAGLDSTSVDARVQDNVFASPSPTQSRSAFGATARLGFTLQTTGALGPLRPQLAAGAQLRFYRLTLQLPGQFASAESTFDAGAISPWLELGASFDLW